jgi:hypothetical protein
MDYKKCKVSDLPKRKHRDQVPRFAKTPVWAAMKADLDAGLKPNEAVRTILDAEAKKKFRIKDKKTIMRFLKQYLADNGLKHHVVRGYAIDGGGELISVSYIPVLRQRA